jgi:integrase
LCPELRHKADAHFGASAQQIELFTMAIRHEVQNLTRRGNIYYWRPRIPTVFSDGVSAGHLSLSLKQSDRNRACYIARKLNTLMHDLKLRPTARMTTKEQLAALFKSEIDRMNDWMEELHFASRHVGSQDNVANVEADIEVGWAYRLLQLFGLRRELSFREDCPAYRLLARAGIPDAHIENIAETFRSEQRGLGGAVFQKQLADQLARFEIPDNISNRERALVEIFRAKADVLLDVEGRYPFTDRELSALTRKPIPLDEPLSIPLSEARVQAVSVVNRPSDIEPPAPRTDQAMNLSESLPASSAPSEGAAMATAVEFRILPISDFMSECENLIRNNTENWAADSAEDVRVLVRIFVGILQEHGVASSRDIRQEHLAALRQHFNDIPTNYGRSSRQRALSTRALRDLAAALNEKAAQEDSAPPKIGLSSATIRRHFGNLQHFLTHLEGAGYPLRPLILTGLKPKKKKTANARTLTEKPAPERLRPLFDLPIFTGCKGELPDEMSVSGDNVFHSSFYFVPMLYTYLGPRRAEITGLGADEIVETQSGWAIDLRYNGYRSLKNPQSVRMLPVPDELTRLNFIDYVHAIKGLGYKALFPELHSPFYKIDTGDRFYKSFMPLLKADKNFSANLWERTIHALRHGFSDTLKQNGVSMSIIEDITGHLGRTEGETRYTNPAGLALIRENIAKYPVVTDHLEPKSIRLLSWVQKREPAPWAISKRSKTGVADLIQR